ncbi:12768_t:CDS:2 [Dentiscutata heterogama]|uniref:12768_t:CDS:1 n=1 Tax=Dentiscutata heterogama TaxID=1316150 RepID=A0ACA9KY22_9GLOM|nr:12768_t:CDS:2 [Dentiscutata heterogama]
MSKRKAKSKDDSQDGSTNLEDTIEAGTLYESQGHERNEMNRQIDTQTKAYVDTIIQATTTSIMENMWQYMDQQLEIQREWSSRCIETINQRFAMLEQTNLIGSGNNNNRPIINSLIVRINPENTHLGVAEFDEVKSVKYKLTSRKFPALSYVSLKPLSDVQGITNKEATTTEQICRWWKLLAFSSFINLQDFVYKNIVDYVKYEGEEAVLQTSESGSISIKKCTHNTAFRDISEWLMVFKAYMEAVLILYENREQELNTYRDHINELCMKYEFTAVMRYDEDR